MKIAICTTGGYYYNWAGGSKFYDWLHKFCESNERFDAHVVSWQPPSVVPDRVKNSFSNIHYRDNNGCDWGCYNFFVDYLEKNNIKDKYDYVIFCHDDILAGYDDWPNTLVDYCEKNRQFEIVSFGGQYHELPEPEHVNSSDNTLGYYKSFDSMCFCYRVSDKLFKDNPFVTIPGHDQDECGDSGCTIVTYNILNLWGAESVGIACREGVGSKRDFYQYVLKFKRGSTVRNPVFPSPDNLCKSNIPPSIGDNHQVIRQGLEIFSWKEEQSTKS